MGDSQKSSALFCFSMPSQNKLPKPPQLLALSSSKFTTCSVVRMNDQIPGTWQSSATFGYVTTKIRNSRS